MSTKCLLDISLTDIYCQVSEGEYLKLWRHIAINQATGQFYIEYNTKSDMECLVVSVKHYWKINSIMVDKCVVNASKKFKVLCSRLDVAIETIPQLGLGARVKGSIERLHHFTQNNFENYLFSSIASAKNASSLTDINNKVYDWCNFVNETEIPTGTMLKQLIHTAFKDNQ